MKTPSRPGFADAAGLRPTAVGRARVPVVRGEVSPKFPRAAARLAGYSGPNLVGLLISFSIHQRMPLFCVDPLRCSGFDRLKVHLY